MSFLSGIMQEGIQRIFLLTGNYGVAIILLTLVIRLVLLPFTLAQTRSTYKMQALQPEIQALQKKYKSDPERMNQEQMALWRKHGVNPLSGCLLLLVQLPFLFAFFRALNDFPPLADARFLGMVLGEPNRVVLPLLAAVTTYFQIKYSSPPGQGEKSQSAMLVAFPLLIGWMSMRFPAALSLYWVTSNLVSIGERFLMPRNVPAKEAGKA